MKAIARLLMITLLAASACYEPYFPPVADGSSVLVVDAFVNCSERSAVIAGLTVMVKQ